MESHQQMHMIFDSTDFNRMSTYTADYAAEVTPQTILDVGESMGRDAWC